MILSIKVPEDLRVKEILKRKDIPCFCKIITDFILIFKFEPFLLKGEVLECNIKKLNLLYPSGAGGEYTYYNHAMVSIDKLSKDHYRISNLKFFDPHLGWRPIIVDGEYAPEPEYNEDF